MVKLAKIYTRGGDLGESGLVGNTRLSKANPRFNAIGDVDEANAAIGMAIATLPPQSPAAVVLQRIQNELFDLGADLATPGDVDGALRVTPRTVTAMETAIDDLSTTLGPLTSFVLPGGSPSAAQLHFARTVVRRAERAVVALGSTEPLNPEILKYLNRLSDFLFQLARDANTQGATDVLWTPGGA